MSRSRRTKRQRSTFIVWIECLRCVSRTWEHCALESSSETFSKNDNRIHRTHRKYKEPVLEYNISHAIRTQDHQPLSWRLSSRPCTPHIKASFHPTWSFHRDEREMRHYVSEDPPFAFPSGSFSLLPSCSPVAVSSHEIGLR